jgi:hypothetical protein
LVTGRCNSCRVFPINTCGPHGTSNNEQLQATNASTLVPPPLLRVKAISSRLSTCIYDRENRSSELSSSTILYRERVNKVFGNDLRGLSLAFLSSSSQLIYLFVRRASRVIAFNVNSIRPIIVFI